MNGYWYEACELLLRADPGLVPVLPAEEVRAGLSSLRSRLAASGATSEQLEGLDAILLRWGEGRPSPNQWFLDYRWLGAQERPVRPVLVSA